MGPYWTKKDGTKVFFEDLAVQIQRDHPEVVGKHIFVQLEALGLFEDFQKGETPYGLPYSFSQYLPDAEVAEWVGLHYGVNFDAESREKKADWRRRYNESMQEAA